MALIAVGGEAATDVIGGLGGLIRVEVALDAFGRPVHEGESSLRRRRVAALTVRREVRPVEREPARLVPLHHRRSVEEAAGRVTAGAVGAQLAAVDVGVASDAVPAGPAEIEGGVAGQAAVAACAATGGNPVAHDRRRG